MTKSRLKNSSSSGAQDKTNTKSGKNKLDKDEGMEKEIGRTGVASDNENYVCDKCFSIWSDEVLDILFRGTDTVTVNSKITYGAVLRFFEWAKAHLGRYANEAVATLLYRADIGDNLRFLQMENFDDELEALLREGEIACCSVFLLIYQPHETVSKIMPENTPRISLKHHIYLFGCKQSTESSPSPDSCESPCKETSSAEISPSRKEVLGSDNSESEEVDMGGAPLPDAPESVSVTDDSESISITDAPESTTITDAAQSTRVTESAPAVDVRGGTPVSDVLESTSDTEVPESAPVANVCGSALVTDNPQASPVQSPRVENKPVSPVLSRKVRNKLGESSESKDNKAKDSDEGGKLKRDSSSMESKEKKVKDSANGQEIKKSSSSLEKVSKPPSTSPLEKEGRKSESSRSVSSVKSEVKGKERALGSNAHSSTKSFRNESVMSNDTQEEPSSQSTCGKESMLKSSNEHIENRLVDKSLNSVKENESTVHKDGREVKTCGNVEGNETPEGKGNRLQTKSVEHVQQINEKELQSPTAKRKTRSMSSVDSDGSSSQEGSQRAKRRKVESATNKEIASGLVPLQISAKKYEVRGDKKVIKDAEDSEKLKTRKSTAKVAQSAMSNDTQEEPSSRSTCGKESILKSSNEHIENKSGDKSLSSMKENESTVHKDSQEITTCGNVDGNETPEEKGNRLQTKTVQKVQQIDEKELQSPTAKRRTRSMSNVDSDGSSSQEGSQRAKRRSVESASNKELASGSVPLQLSAKQNEVRGDMKVIKDAEDSEKLKTRKSTAKEAHSVIKDAENNEKLKARKSTTEVAQSPKEDIVMNNGNDEKVNKFKESGILSAVCGANEKAGSHSTYEKPYVTRAGDRMQRRRRSGNLQDCTDGERKYSLLKEKVEKNQEKTEIIKRIRKRDENDVQDYPGEQTLTAKRNRFYNVHIPEKNIIQTRRKSKGSIEPVVSKEIAALLTETEDSDSAYEISAETDGESSDLDNVNFKEPAVKKVEMKQKGNKLLYTKALESIKEFDANFMHKLSFKDIGDLVVNVSAIDFSQFDGPQSTRRGVTKEWLENPVPKTVAVSNGMILELFEYLFKRMTVIKVLSVMFWLLKKLDSKLQTSNSVQVKDAVALVIKEFEAMDEDMFVVYKLMPFKPTNVRYITQTSLDMKDSKRIPYLTFANGEMLFLHNHLVLNPTNPDPLRFYNLIRSIMDLRSTVLLVPDSQTLVQIGESVRKEFYAQRLAGTEQEFVCKEWDCKKLFRTEKPAVFQTKVKVRDILAHFMKWKNAAKENGGVVYSAMELNHSIEGLFDKTIELRGIVISSRFDKVGFCFQLYAKYCDIVFLQKNLKSGLEFLEGYTGLDEILFFQSRRKLKSQCDTELTSPGKCKDVQNEENINVSQLKSQISTLSNELDVLTDANKHSENKMKELVKNISSLKKGVNAEQSQLISQIAEISVTLQGKKEGSKMPASKDSKKKVKKFGALSSVCSAIKDLVANDVPVDEIRHIIEVIMENIVGKEPCNVPDDEWIHKYVKELDTSCEMD